MAIKKKKLLANEVVEARGQKPHMGEAFKRYIDNKLQLIIDGRVHSFPFLLKDGSIIQMLYQIKVDADLSLKFMLESSDTLSIWFPERQKRNARQHIQYINETILNDDDIKKFMFLQARLKQLSDEFNLNGQEAPRYAY
jgi:hypothetical protein